MLAMTTTFGLSEIDNLRQNAKQLLRNEQYKESIVVLNKLENKCLDNKHKIINKIASVYIKLNDFKKAIESYKKSIRINPSYSETYNELGMVYQQLNDVQNAKLNYLQCITLNKKKNKKSNIYGLFNLAKLSMECHEYSESEEYFKRCLYASVEPKASIHYHYSVLLCYHLNKMNESLYHIQKAIDIKPNIANYHFQHALILSKVNQFEKANTSFLKSLELSYNEPKILSEYTLFLKQKYHTLDTNNNHDSDTKKYNDLETKKYNDNNDNDDEDEEEDDDDYNDQKEGDSLPILKDKSKYKQIALMYCQRKMWKNPIENVKPSVAGFMAEVIFGPPTKEQCEIGFGSKKKEAAHDAYCKLIQTVIPKQDALELILKFSDNAEHQKVVKSQKLLLSLTKHPKSVLLEWTKLHNMQAPKTIFTPFVHEEYDRIMWTAKVVFRGETVESLGGTKKDAERKCFNQLLKHIEA